MADILSAPAPAARRAPRLPRLAAICVGIAIALAYLVAWPKTKEAMFWSGSRTVDEIAQFITAQSDIPGAVIATGRAGENPRLRAFGVTKAGREMTTDHVFSLASLSKPVTAAAVMRLVEAGRFSLNDRLVDLVPMAAEAADPHYRGITVRHLLQHRGGWERAANFGLQGDDCEPVAREAMAEPLAFAPGTRNLYSNIGYCWLELIVARHSGLGYEAYVRNEVLARAGAAGLALKHPLLGGFGGWSGTAADYFRFASMPVHPWQTQATVRLESPPFDYGLGVVVLDGAVGHWGWLTGGERVFTLALRNPDGTTMVAFFNDHPADARGTAAKALRAFRAGTTAARASAE